MDWSDYGKELLKGKNVGALKALAKGSDGQKLAGMLDRAAAEQALQKGDAAALQGMLDRLLATPEGQRLAQEVKKAVKGHG